MIKCVNCGEGLDPVEDQNEWGEVECKCGSTSYIIYPEGYEETILPPVEGET